MRVDIAGLNGTRCSPFDSRFVNIFDDFIMSAFFSKFVFIILEI